MERVVIKDKNGKPELQKYLIDIIEPSLPRTFLVRNDSALFD